MYPRLVHPNIYINTHKHTGEKRRRIGFLFGELLISHARYVMEITQIWKVDPSYENTRMFFKANYKV